MLISPGNTLTGTLRNKILRVIPASLSPLKLTHAINHYMGEVTNCGGMLPPWCYGDFGCFQLGHTVKAQLQFDLSLTGTSYDPLWYMMRLRSLVRRCHKTTFIHVPIFLEGLYLIEGYEAFSHLSLWF